MTDPSAGPGNGGSLHRTGTMSPALPDWLPVTVRDLAVGFLNYTTEAGLDASSVTDALPQLVRFRRLVFDERMERVWRELQRRKRDVSGYMHPAWGNPKASFGDQQQCMAHLFLEIVANT